MATKTFTNTDANNLWGDPFNWSSATLPIPGDIAVIPGLQTVNFGDLGLFNIAVELSNHSEMQGNYLSLAGNSSIEGDGGVEAATNIVTGRMAFIGVTQAGAGMEVAANAINNNGTIGAEVGGGGSLLLFVDGNQSKIVNSGQLISNNGGDLRVSGGVTTTSTLSGSGETDVKNGATLELSHINVASAQKLNLGGEDATTLAFDPENTSIAANIAGFLDTDVMDLLDFTVQSVTASSTLNPTLRITGVELSQNKPSTFTLKLTGNYANDQFSTVSDGKLGTLLAVNLT